MIRFLILIALGVALGGAETVAPPTPATPPAPASGPFLGVTLEDGGNLDGGAEVRVTRVLPDSTFARLGVQAGDVIDRLDDSAVRTVAEFGAAAAALRTDTDLRVAVRRGGQSRVLSGPIAPLPRPRDLASDAEKLGHEVAEVAAAVEREHVRADLAETLRLLTEFEHGLPRTAAEFKKVYPKGTFKIRIDIDIRSDAEAADPKPLVPAANAAAGTSEPAK